MKRRTFLSSALAAAFGGPFLPESLGAATREFRLEEATIASVAGAMDAGRLTSERLVELYLARIDAYENNGPRLNSLISVNPWAREAAVALDAERRWKGPRGPLHGIPVVLKDNIDTVDLPTSGIL